MRTWVIIIAVAFILSSVAIGEKLYIMDFTSQIDEAVSSAKDKIHSDIPIDNEEKKLQKLWKERKNMVFTFTNHNVYSGIDEHLVKIKYYSDKSDFNNVMIQLLLLQKDNNNLKEMIKFNLANVF